MAMDTPMATKESIMLKMIVLWVLLQGKPVMISSVKVDNKTAIVYMHSQNAIQTCEKNAQYFRSIGIVAWCAPSLDF